MFLYSHWLRLPIMTRIKIAHLFNIEKKGATHVVDNQIQNDGFSVKDIESAITKDSIHSYIGDTSINDLEILFNKLVDKINEKPLLEKEEIRIVSESIIKEQPKIVESTTLVPKIKRDRVTKLKTNEKNK